MYASFKSGENSINLVVQVREFEKCLVLKEDLISGRPREKFQFEGWLISYLISKGKSGPRNWGCVNRCRKLA